MILRIHIFYAMFIRWKVLAHLSGPDLPSSGSPVSLKTTNTTLSVSPIKKNAPTSSMALHNFKLLEALRSDDPRQVQPFLDELKPSPGSIAGQDDMGKAGSLLGMAVKVASGR